MPAFPRRRCPPLPSLSLSPSYSHVRLLLATFFLSLFSLSHSLHTHSPRSNLPSSPNSLQPYPPSPLAPTPSGLLFISTLDGDLHALDLRSGVHRWSFGTGQALLRSAPATSPLDSLDPSDSPPSPSDWDLSPSDDDAPPLHPPSDDNLIIPGVNGQLFFSTRQGQLERLPVTVNDLVAASPFKASDDRWYVGKKSSAFIQLDRRTGQVLRVLNEDGDQLTTDGSCDPSDAPHPLALDAIWIGRQELSVRAFHGLSGGKQWNVSLSEYFAHIDGGVDKAHSEGELQELGLPHLAATVDGRLYAIKNVVDRERYLWSYAFSSPISSVHFSRDPGPDPAVLSRALIKLPVYYLPPASRTDGVGELSPVSQYLYVRMKAAKSKAVDTYVGLTKDGVLYALPNPPSTSDTTGLPTELDPLFGYLPPPEDAVQGAMVVPTQDVRVCTAAHPLYPVCLRGVHSISEPSLEGGFTYLGLQGLPGPQLNNASHLKEPHRPDVPPFPQWDSRDSVGSGWWTTVVTSAVVTACMMAPLLLTLWYTQLRANAKRKKRKPKAEKPPAARGEGKEGGEVVGVPPTPPPADSGEVVARGVRVSSKALEADDERKELEVPSTPTQGVVLPSPASRLSASTSASQQQLSSPSPTNSDGSLAIPSTLSSVLSSMSHVYAIGKIQIFADQVLGTGSMGTVVYAGLHETRECAVKRLVKPFFGHDNADKEISLLIQSDQHANVLRYYAKEEDASFIYIALEKCAGSLQDLIERPHDYPHAHHLHILHDMMTGLAHLHALNIVHRDLKPANILLTAAHHCKLADMGLGKQLDLMRSSFDSVVSGSFGWQPPEVLGGEGSRRLTKAVDVFSAGCVVYYVMSAGAHPFGANVEREVNIVKANASYRHLRSHRVEAQDLISSMITHNPDDRLSASDCVHHPLFWSDEQKLHFLLDVSDRVEAEPEYSECRLTLERRAGDIVGPQGWDGKLHRGLLDNLGKFRKYDFTSLRDLLRVIRNKRHHYRDLPEEVQRELGPVPGGFLGYFEARFPELLMWAYRVMACFCLEREGEVLSVCPLDEMEEDERAGRAVPALSVPLKEWDGLVMTTQFRPYYQHVSMKRLLQLQEDARMRYRVWSNDEEGWVQGQCNVNASDSSRRVRLVKGWGEKVARWAEDSAQRVKDEAREERIQRDRAAAANPSPGTTAGDRGPTPGPVAPPLSSFPPLSPSPGAPRHPSTPIHIAPPGFSFPGSGRTSPGPGPMPGLSTSPGTSPSLASTAVGAGLHSPPPVRAVPAAAAGTGWDAPRSWTTAVLTPPPVAAAAPVASPVAGGGGVVASGMVRLAKRPGIKTLTPMKAGDTAGKEGGQERQ